MKNTSQIIRQLGILFWDGCKGLFYCGIETTLMPLGGRGIGPSEGAGAGLAGGLSWSRLFVSFWSQKEKKEKVKLSSVEGQEIEVGKSSREKRGIRFIDIISWSRFPQFPSSVQDVPSISFCDQKEKKI